MTDQGPNQPPDAIVYSEINAARLLGIAAETLRKYRTRGLVEAVRIGRRVVYRRADLERFVETLRRSA